MATTSARLTRRIPTVFLQCVIVLVGLLTLTFLLWEPHLEGRNKDATVFDVYFKDPFLAYVYVASIPFFVALYHGFKVLGYARHEKLFSPSGVRALRIIKFCALAVVALVAGSFVFMFFTDPDDRPQGVMMRVFVAVPTIIVAAAAVTFERMLQNAVEMKSENDLTV